MPSTAAAAAGVALKRRGVFPFSWNNFLDSGVNWRDDDNENRRLEAYSDLNVIRVYQNTTEFL